MLTKKRRASLETALGYYQQGNCHPLAQQDHGNQLLTEKWTFTALQVRSRRRHEASPLKLALPCLPRRSSSAKHSGLPYRQLQVTGRPL